MSLPFHHQKHCESCEVSYPSTPSPPKRSLQELLDGSQGAKGIVIGFAQFSSYKNLLPGNASGRAC